MEDKDSGISAQTDNRVTIVMRSYSLDGLYSAMIISTGALAMGMEASIYFTFWGLFALKKNGLKKAPLSKLNMLGLGRVAMKLMMRSKNVATLEQLFSDFKELGGKIIACDMTMEIMHIKKEDLRRDLISDCGAVGTYLNDAMKSKITLII